jgi:hypothetical protein
MKTQLLSASVFWIFYGIGVNAQTFTFDFDTGSNQFVGGVSDFGLNQSGQHEFMFSNEELPPPLPSGQNAQFISGINPSDDLFMFMKRQITGLQPNTTYHVTFSVEFASIYPTNAIGVGGAPGEGVTMKAGITLIEPDTMTIEKGGPYVVMNIDKGNQSHPGPDMDTIGHVGVSDTTTVYTLKTNDNLSSPFLFTTDSSGEGWIIIGTDSGFESTTAIYYTNVNVDFTIETGRDDIRLTNEVAVYPNPSTGQIRIDPFDADLESINVFDVTGNLIYVRSVKSSLNEIILPTGMFVLHLQTSEGMVIKKVLVQ